MMYIMLILFSIGILFILHARHKYLDRDDTGKKTENFVYKKINSLHYGKIYKNNIIFYPGSSSEMDIILVTKKGVFIIECKGYRGKVKITDKICKLNKRVEMRNPITQNETHCKILKTYLNKYDINVPIYSMVVFGYPTKKLSVPKIYKKNVCKINKLKKNMKEQYNKLSDSVSDEEFKKLNFYILRISNRNKDEMEEHIRNCKKREAV